MLSSFVRIWEVGTESSLQKDDRGTEKLVGRCVGMTREGDELGRSRDKRPKKRKGLLAEILFPKATTGTNRMWTAVFTQLFAGMRFCYNTAIV